MDAQRLETLEVEAWRMMGKLARVVEGYSELHSALFDATWPEKSRMADQAHRDYLRADRIHTKAVRRHIRRGKKLRAAMRTAE